MTMEEWNKETGFKKGAGNFHTAKCAYCENFYYHNNDKHPVCLVILLVNMVASIAINGVSVSPDDLCNSFEWHPDHLWRNEEDYGD